MSVKEFFDKLNNGARWDVGVSINRSNALPLDANSVFSSLVAAQNYAEGNPAEGVLNNAYPGQIISVVAEDGTVQAYIIRSDGQLEEIGGNDSQATKDYVQAWVDEVLSLFINPNFDAGVVTNSQPSLTLDGGQVKDNPILQSFDAGRIIK